MEKRTRKVPEKSLKVRSSYKVEVYGKAILHSGEEFANLIKRDIYREEDLARKGISRILVEKLNGNRILLSVKEGKDKWTLLETINM
ncbi:MAG: hypothetical protein ACRCSK_08995 [Fusobacteriaceae bacterium]